jgi:hypothetical protein
MRRYALAIFTAALFALPTSAAFSQVNVEIGPGGVRVGPGYHRHLYNRSDEGRCGGIEAGVRPQGTVRRGRHGQLPKISANVPLTFADGNRSYQTNNASPYERGVCCVCAIL